MFDRAIEELRDVAMLEAREDLALTRELIRRLRREARAPHEFQAMVRSNMPSSRSPR